MRTSDLCPASGVGGGRRQAVAAGTVRSWAMREGSRERTQGVWTRKHYDEMRRSVWWTGWIGSGPRTSGEGTGRIRWPIGHCPPRPEGGGWGP
jgi:hypothetical protein